MKLKYRLTSDGKSYIVVGCDSVVGEVKIPARHNKKLVTSIGNYAFYGCSALSSIDIPEGVTTIGEYAFFNCSNLASINIPEGVTKIGESAFSGCSNLASINIPVGVTAIGNSAFSGCSGLTAIFIPESITEIGNYVFYGCSNLVSINIPNSVTSIGNYAFYGCSALTSILSIGTRKTKAVKAFNRNLTCRGFQYKVGKNYNVDSAKLCEVGFHACTTGTDLFNYYWGKNNKDVVFYEVELDGITDEREDDSKVCGTSIRLLRKLTIAEAANYRSEV